MQIELDILNFIQNNMQNPILTNILKVITYMGNIGLIWIILALIFMITKAYRNIGFTLVIGLIMCLVIGNLILKPIISRTRPYNLEVNQKIELAINKPKDFSFPSGHTLAAFTSAVIIFLYNKKIGILALIFASLIAFSRLYFYVHFPTDVLAGIILGIAFAIISKKIYEIIKKKLTNRILN